MWDGDLLTRDYPDCEERQGLGEGSLLTRDYPGCEARQDNLG
jgi:hypothetical protein